MRILKNKYSWFLLAGCFIILCRQTVWATASVDPAPAQALVRAWLNAQNQGDFAAYSGLYAERMTGIKRSGPRMRQFNRASWLQDRERMFKKAMQVSVDDLSVIPADDGFEGSLFSVYRHGPD